MRLGRLPADQAQLARMPQLAGHRLAARRAPPVLNRSITAYTPQMFDNDRYGNCTAASYGNNIIAAAAVAPIPWLPIITTEKVDRFYSASTGFDPADPSTDQGAVLADVLAFQAQNGFDHGAQDEYVADFATIDPEDINALCSVMAATGALYVGVNLAQADQTDAVWDTSAPGDQTPGSWGPNGGGHCPGLWDYSGTGPTDIVRVITWAGLRPATWRWWISRAANGNGEAHMLTWRAVDGVDHDRLKADVTTFLAGPIV